MNMLTDLILCSGTLIMSYGAWLYEPSLGFATGGALLITCGVMRGLAEARAKGGGS